VSTLERDIVEFIAEQGPCSTADLAALIGHERKAVARAAERLQRQLILTTAGAQEREQGWPAVILDLVSRRYASHLRRLPSAEDAQAELAELILQSAREVSAADVAAVIGCRRKRATAALERLVDEGVARPRDEEGFRLYVR
jgi:CRP-like cAMP-binding protein